MLAPASKRAGAPVDARMEVMPAMETPDTREANPSLREYLSVLWRRKGYIVLITILVLGVAMFYSTRQTPRYRSSSQVLVLPVNFSPTEPSGQGTSANMINEVGIMTSSNVRRLAAQQLQRSGIPMSPVTVDTPVASGILVVEASSPIPASAQATANAFAEAYLQFRLDSVLDDLRAISEPIEARLETINRGVIKTQNDLLDAKTEAARSSLQITLGSLFTQRSLLEQKLNELVLPENLRVGEVLQPAALPTVPYSPNHGRTAGFALFVGLCLGVGAAFLSDRLDPRLKSRDDLETQAKAPVIGMIPRTTGRGRSRVPLPILQEPESPAGQAYRILRASLLTAMAPDDMKTVVVTSPHRGEGKTAVTANVAVALARSGRRVIVVSDDLAEPPLAELFGPVDGASLYELVERNWTVETPIQNLWVVEGKSTSSDFETLMATDRMEQVLSQLGSAMDIVLIDSPAVLDDADVAVLAPLAHAVLLVADGSRTTGLSVREARRQLDQVGARVLGAVLTNADELGDHRRTPSRRSTRDVGRRGARSVQTALSSDGSVTVDGRPSGHEWLANRHRRSEAR
jgi:capsular exopolysaccharide synthesis family protein